jgi:osmotically-inducible protein OsmY
VEPINTVTYISVNSVDGVVTLGGEVRNQRAKVVAGEIARSVSEVAGVNNDLAIAPGYAGNAGGAKE